MVDGRDLGAWNRLFGHATWGWDLGQKNNDQDQELGLEPGLEQGLQDELWKARPDMRGSHDSRGNEQDVESS